MRIQYASDLHLEFDENICYLKAGPLEVTGDILILAGDTIYFGAQMSDADWFFDWCSANYRQTYLIPGNHEYYGGFPMEKTIEDFEWRIRDNVTYLNNKSVVLGNTEIFFTTLWTSIPFEESYTIEKIMNDCKKARMDGRRFGSRAWNHLHQYCVRWLAGALAESKAAHKIVVSHHCPYLSSLGAKYVGSMAVNAYMNDMWPMMENAGIEYWIHGHVHLPLRSQRGDALILSNPMGYVDDGENQSFLRDAAIEICQGC